MTVTTKVLVSPRNVDTAQTTQYTATNLSAIIDKCTVTNYSSTAATVSINLATSGSSAASSNLVMQNKTIQPGETYTCPEVVGHILAPGGFISTIASTTLALNLRVSGREVT